MDEIKAFDRFEEMSPKGDEGRFRLGAACRPSRTLSRCLGAGNRSPQSADAPGHEARMALYAERAARKLPLFAPRQ